MLKEESTRGVAPATGVELGVFTNGVIRGYMDEEVNQPDVELKKLMQMVRRDGQAAMLYRILTLPLRAAQWKLVPAEGGDKEHALVKENFENPPHMGGMSTPIAQVTGGAARAMLTGFSYWEKVYQEYKGRLVYRKLAYRDPDTLTFLTDEHGGYNGIRQQAIYKGRIVDVKIPRDKGFFFTFGKEVNPLYGESAFNPAFYHYEKKHKLYYIAALAEMVGAIPPRYAMLPEEIRTSRRDIVQAVQNILQNIGLNTSFTWPEEAGEIKTIQNGGSGGNVLSLIEHHDTMMARSVLAQFIMLGGGGSSGGAYALSKDMSDFFLMSLEAVFEDWTSTVNWYVIPDLVDLNFGSGKYPRYELEPLVDSAKVLLQEVFKTVMSAPDGKVSPEFLLEAEKSIAKELKFELDYEEIGQRQLEFAKLKQDADSKLLEDTMNSDQANGNGDQGGGSGGGQGFMSEGDKVLVELAEAIKALQSL